MNANTNNSFNLHGLYALFTLAIILVLIYTLIVSPLLKIKEENKDRIETAIFQLEKLNNLRSNIVLLKDSMENLKKRNENVQGFIKKTVPAIAAADLQEKITTLIESNGGNVVSTAVVRKNDESIYTKVTIKTHMRANIVTLNKVLYELVKSNPILFTDNLLIQKKNLKGRNAKQTNELLEIRFEVSGFMNG
ncbi:MAG: hypothetical protein GKR93_08475 [Gammaproteobacteria bacterium]|nr:hypothetical protein [Gammaproteobacteria bacterium]